MKRQVDYTWIFLALVKPNGREKDLFSQTETLKSYSLGNRVKRKKAELL